MTFSEMRGARTFVWILVLAAAWFAFDWLTGGSNAGDAAAAGRMRLEARVQTECQDALTQLLVSPATMRVAGRTRPLQQANGQWRYAFTIDSQNAFGALIRSSWLCVFDGSQPMLTQQD